VNVGPFQILIIALVILVLFGRGRISDMMGDFGKGVKSFRRNLADDDEAAPREALAGDGDATVPAQPASDRSPH
jgi:sec-independent protein translocase protein TatA